MGECDKYGRDFGRLVEKVLLWDVDEGKKRVQGRIERCCTNDTHFGTVKKLVRRLARFPRGLGI